MIGRSLARRLTVRIAFLAASVSILSGLTLFVLSLRRRPSTLRVLLGRHGVFDLFNHPINDGCNDRFVNVGNSVSNAASAISSEDCASALPTTTAPAVKLPDPGHPPFAVSIFVQVLPIATAQIRARLRLRMEDRPEHVSHFVAAAPDQTGAELIGEAAVADTDLRRHFASDVPFQETDADRIRAIDEARLEHARGLGRIVFRLLISLNAATTPLEISS